MLPSQFGRQWRIICLAIWAPLAYICDYAGSPHYIAETPLFVRQAADVWDRNEHDAFVDYVARNPEAGDVIPETGGVRKLRWRRPGTGKRGGVRVVYFYYGTECPIYLLMVYAKAMQGDMSPDEKKAARKLTAELKNIAQSKRSQRGHR